MRNRVLEPVTDAQSIVLAPGRGGGGGGGMKSVNSLHMGGISMSRLFFFFMVYLKLIKKNVVSLLSGARYFRDL